MNNFFAELKRRNVVRVGIAYVVVAWVIAQVIDLAADNFAVPEWFTKMVLIILVLGLPVALILSWAYELTPEGVKKTEDVEKQRSITPKTGQKINKIIIAFLGLAVLFLLADKFWLKDQSAEAGQASIAVLPFVNMSADASNEYFADGLSEELLNVLAKIPELKVAGRTSSFQFKGENLDLREIGNKLGVETILEGSVRKQGDRVRITAQLVRASDGFHLWSETYDRNLEDIFAVQDEISAAILDELSVTLSLGEKRADSVPTTNMAAYDRYLEARVLVSRRGRENLERAENLLLEATQADPGYAEAWALLANVYTLRPAYDIELNITAFSQRGVRAAERAIELNPTIGLAYTGLGSAYSNLQEFSKAHKAFEQGWEFNKNDAEGNSQFGQFLAGVGKFEEAQPYTRRAHELDPLSELYALVLATQVGTFGEYDEATALFDMVQSPGLLSLKNFLQIIPALTRRDVKEALEQARENVTRSNFQHLPGLFERLLKVYDDREAARQVLRDFWETHKDTSQDARRVVFWLFLIAFKEHELAANAILLEDEKDENRFSLNGVFLLNDRDFLNFEPLRAVVREKGLVEYWQEFGFPSYCHAVGDDDYECGLN